MIVLVWVLQDPEWELSFLGLLNNEGEQSRSRSKVTLLWAEFFFSCFLLFIRGRGGELSKMAAEAADREEWLSFSWFTTWSPMQVLEEVKMNFMSTDTEKNLNELALEEGEPGEYWAFV